MASTQGPEQRLPDTLLCTAPTRYLTLMSAIAARAGEAVALIKGALERGNRVVFLDVSIGGRAAGRIKLELFHSVCPRVRARTSAGGLRRPRTHASPVPVRTDCLLACLPRSSPHARTDAVAGLCAHPFLRATRTPPHDALHSPIPSCIPSPHQPPSAPHTLCSRSHPGGLYHTSLLTSPNTV